MAEPVAMVQRRLEKQVKDWNEQNPVGRWVEFHSTIGSPAHRLVQTHSEAWILSGHTAVVTLTDVPGCIALDACVPISDEEAERRRKTLGTSFVIMVNDFPQAVCKTKEDADAEVSRLERAAGLPNYAMHIRWQEVRNA